jgi:EmrB/QacA subfamily drug resistance transporter
VLAGAAQTMLQLVSVRALQGLGAGMLFATTFAVVGDLYSARERGKVQGAFAAMFGLASVVGPTLGGWITDATSWRWIFYINIPIGILAFAVVFVGMPWARPRGHERPSLDVLGGALLVVAVISLLLGVVWGGDRYDWESPQIAGLFAVSAVLLALFVLAERRASEPILPLSLFRNRTFTVSAIALALLGAGMFGAITLVPLFLQGSLGVAATNSGSLMTPMMLSIVVGATTGGQVMSRTGRYKLLMLGGVALMLVGALLFTTVSAEMSRAEVIPYMVLLGFGLGITLPTTTTVVQNALPFELLGVASASVQFFRSMGGTLGVALLTGIMLSRFRDGLADAAGGAATIVQSPNALLNEDAAESLRATYEQTAGSGDPPFDVVLEAVRDTLADAIGTVFFVAAGIVAVAFLVVLFLPELPLRQHSPRDLARLAHEGRTLDADGDGLAPAAGGAASSAPPFDR